MIAHNVFFSLKESSPENISHLVAACHQYLSGHDGTAFYSAGSRCEDLQRPVNDGDFDVSLHVIFETREAHDAYQVADRHTQFIEENKENWKQVRVFDSVVSDSVVSDS